jgi:hypothetical protein
MMAFLLLLVPTPGAAESPSTPEQDARVRSESEKLRQNQERVLQDNDKRIAEIQARETGVDETLRAEKITRDRVLAAGAVLSSGAALPGGVASKGETWGQTLGRMAEGAERDPRAMAEVYGAQTEYVNNATAEWADGPERRKLQDSAAQLQTNMETVKSNLTQTTEAAEATTTRLPQSRVLEKVAQVETAAKEAGERLSARWERERAAREREREQREREAAERAREQRR